MNSRIIIYPISPMGTHTKSDEDTSGFWSATWGRT